MNHDRPQVGGASESQGTVGQADSGIMQSVADHVVVLDSDGAILFANQSFVGLVEDPGSDVVGAPLTRFLTIDPEQDVAFQSGSVSSADGLLHCLRSQDRPVVVERLAPGGRDKTTIGDVVAIHDPTIAPRVSARVAYLRSHDPLSGLPDRQQALDAIAAGLADQNADSDIWFGVLRVNGGQFRSAVDLELAIASVVEALRREMPSDISMFRTASDFVTCVGVLDRSSDLSHGLATVAEAGMSGGLTHVTRLEAQGFFLQRGTLLDLPRCLVDAEGIFDRAKERDQRVAIPIAGSDVDDELVKDFDAALNEGQLEFYLQPEVSAESGVLLGAELLCRWNHPVQGLMPPHRFIPMADSDRFRGRFSNWCVEAAFNALERLRQEGFGDLRLAMNISAAMLEQTDLPDNLAQRRCDSWSLAGQLEIEITESTLAQDFHQARQHLRHLRAQGYKVAIDDFGTGYSSLSYLRELPIDRLKIDRSFVRGLPDNEDDALICTAVMSLSHALGLQVIAEGVETRAQAHFLRESGCEILQGYLISKPVPFDAFLAIAMNWESIDVGLDDVHEDFEEDSDDRPLRRVHWKRSFSVDITSIDKEHADIIKHINRVADLLQGGASLPMVTGHVETIVAETRRHFRHEETVMANIGFPHIARHKAKHDALIAEVERYLETTIHGSRPPSPNRLLSYLKFWFLRHLITEDRKIERFINGRPAQSDAEAAKE